MKQLFFSVALLFVAVIMNAQEDPKGLSINDTAPDFTAIDQEGKPVNLKQQLEKGPVVLVFYRGYWCPYCNKYLQKLEDSLSLINGKGASLITITPEKPESIKKTIEKSKASYPVLYDEGLSIMKKYDVAFAVDEKTVDRYKGFGIDFNQVNGSANGANLPVPAIYIINTDGKIVFRHFDKNYTKRASVADILTHL